MSVGVAVAVLAAGLADAAAGPAVPAGVALAALADIRGDAAPGVAARGPVDGLGDTAADVPAPERASGRGDAAEGGAPVITVAAATARQSDLRMRISGGKVG